MGVGRRVVLVAPPIGETAPRQGRVQAQVAEVAAAVAAAAAAATVEAALLAAAPAAPVVGLAWVSDTATAATLAPPARPPPGSGTRCGRASRSRCRRRRPRAGSGGGQRRSGGTRRGSPDGPRNVPQRVGVTVGVGVRVAAGKGSARPARQTHLLLLNLRCSCHSHPRLPRRHLHAHPPWHARGRGHEQHTLRAGDSKQTKMPSTHTQAHRHRDLRLWERGGGIGLSPRTHQSTTHNQSNSGQALLLSLLSTTTS